MFILHQKMFNLLFKNNMQIQGLNLSPRIIKINRKTIKLQF